MTGHLLNPSTQPAVTTADPDLRRARELLDEGRITPIVEGALLPLHPSDEDGHAIVRKAARVRILRFLAARMGLSVEEADPKQLSLEECRQAWVALQGVSYGEIRLWATQHRAPPRKAGGAR